MTPRPITVALHHPGRTVAVVALLTVVLGTAATRLRVDNSPENWLPADAALREELALFRERFGDDSLILVLARTGEAPASDAWRLALARLVDSLRRVDGVAWVLAPPAALPPQTDDPYEAELATGDAAVRPPLEPFLVSRDGRRVGIAVGLAAGLDPVTRSRLVSRLDAALAEATPQMGPLGLAGADVMTHDLDRGTLASLARLGPVVLAIMTAILVGATGSARAAGAVVATAGIAATWTLGLMVLAGRPMTMVGAALPAILAVTATALATHLLTHYLGLHAGPAETATRAGRAACWQQAIRTTWHPSLASALTTAAGFAALTTSGIAPIRDLGAFTAVGVLLVLAVTFTFLPAVLSLSRRVLPHPVEARVWTLPRARALALRLRDRAPAILAAASLAAVAGALGASRLRVESHVLHFFPADHRVPRAYREIEAALLGLTPFELVVEGPREQMLAPASLAALDAWLAAARKAEPLLLQVISPLAAVAPGAPPGERARVLRARLPASAADLPEPVRRHVWLSPDGSRLALRTTLAARTDSSEACHALVERLRAGLASRVPPGLAATITGGPTVLIRGQVLLVQTQLRSFALSFLIVTALIALHFRSPALVAASLVPNLLPVVLTLGLMGWLGIPLDTATVTVAGIALGLLIDDTIHLLHHYAAARRSGLDAPDGVADALYLAGRPVLLTTVAVAAGFGAFAASPFPILRHFGLLIAATAGAALLCDLLLLPALLLWRRPPAPD